MKLYTEEQVRDMLSGAIRSQWIDEYLLRYTSIELPTDDQILSRSHEEPTNEYKAFQRGAIWMRDKILNK